MAPPLLRLFLRLFLVRTAAVGFYDDTRTLTHAHEPTRRKAPFVAVTKKVKSLKRGCCTVAA